MSRVLVVPDAHLKTETIEKGLELADLFMATHVVLLGDYFDNWSAPRVDYIKMAEYLKKMLKVNPNVFPLLGNHELSYLGFPCSGYSKEAADVVKGCIENDKRFWTCVAIDGVLYSHAGVTDGWVRYNKLLTENERRYNLKTSAAVEMLEEKIARAEENKKIFYQVGASRGGTYQSPSPLWADLSELLADPIGDCKQVVGHTPVKNIEHFGNIWFCDTQSNGNECDEYLFVVDGTPQVINYDYRMSDERRMKKWN